MSDSLHPVARASGTPALRRGGAVLLRWVLPVAGLALATALAAQVRVPVPGSPVPMTLQSLPVLLAPVLMGPGRGAAAMALYIVLGLVGFPVFAGDEAGPRYIFGATGGYLLGFVAAQPVIGWALRPSGRAGAPRGADWRHLLAALVLAHAVIWAMGVGWLKVVSGGAWGAVLAQGLWPFLPGDVIKCAMAAIVGATILATRRG